MSMVGIIGLGVMGRNLALNFNDSGLDVVGCDNNQEMISLFHELNIGRTVKSIPEMILNLSFPRTIILMLPAGSTVDVVIDILLEHLLPGDMIIDAGNSNYNDSIRRERYINKKNISFVGLGISGGAEGARYGASFMFGCSDDDICKVKKLFKPLAAKINGRPCLEHFGSLGAGHFIKTIHNGIEYGIMQVIAEAYLLVRSTCQLSPNQVASIFSEWNKGYLSSYLINITSEILSTIDCETDLPLIDCVLDRTGQNNTGKWALIAAMELGVAVPTIAEAVHARDFLSARKESYRGYSEVEKIELDSKFINFAEQSLISSILCIYMQGLSIIESASKKSEWSMPLQKVIEVWLSGCIIQSHILEDLYDNACLKTGDAGFLVNDYFIDSINKYQDGWREVIKVSVENKLPVPATASALSYWDSFNSKKLWGDMIQLQRDRFGLHGFNKFDSESVTHGTWNT